MKTPADMSLFELRDEFVLVARCALESGEYRERAAELASALLDRGFGVPEIGAYLDALASVDGSDSTPPST